MSNFSNKIRRILALFGSRARKSFSFPRNRSRSWRVSTASWFSPRRTANSLHSSWLTAMFTSLSFRGRWRFSFYTIVENISQENLRACRSRKNSKGPVGSHGGEVGPYRLVAITQFAAQFLRARTSVRNGAEILLALQGGIPIPTAKNRQYFTSSLFRALCSTPCELCPWRSANFSHSSFVGILPPTLSILPLPPVWRLCIKCA